MIFISNFSIDGAHFSEKKPTKIQIMQLRMFILSNLLQDFKMGLINVPKNLKEGLICLILRVNVYVISTYKRLLSHS